MTTMKKAKKTMPMQQKAMPWQQNGKPMAPKAGMPGMAKKGGKKGKGC